MTEVLPPFDPPYITLHHDGSNTHCTETLADGTTRPVAIPQAAPRTDANFSETRIKKSARPVSKSLNKIHAGKCSPHNDLPAAHYLNVPFAEKDNAKKLGAKWDATKRKWYVPYGLDANLFSQWRADDLK